MRTRTIRRVILATLLAGSAVSLAARADAAGVPKTITNQGRLFGADNKPIEGSLTVIFAIYVQAQR